MQLRNKLAINEIREKLFILLGFVLPLSIAITNILIIVIALLCIIEGGFFERWQKIKSSRWMISSLFLLLLYFLYYLILGTFSDTFWALKRVSLLLILPILYTTYFSSRTIKKSTFAFLTSMFISSVFAIFANYEIIFIWEKPLQFKYGFHLKYTDHNVFLAAALLLSTYCMFKLKLKSAYKIIIQIFIPVYLFSLFTEGGKVGQIVFVILLSSFLIYFFHSKIKVLLLSFLGLFLFSYLVYNNSDMVQKRFYHIIQFYKNLDNKEKVSTNTRYVLGTETLSMIKQNPIFGYGAGSFTDVFGKINEKTRKIVNEKHKTPHNNYLYVWMEIGILGLLLLVAIFYFQIKEFSQLKDGFFRALLPIMYIIIMFSDSYFLSNDTLILYLFLSVITTSYQYKLA